MEENFEEQINQYCRSMSSPESEFLQAIQDFTWKKMINPRMLTGHLQGQFLSMIIALKQPKTVLEIGTFTGYGTACLLENMPNDAVLHTIEANAETASKTQAFWRHLHQHHKVQWHVGDALDIIPTLAIRPDLVYIDADKINYKNYLDVCFDMIPSGGLLIFDNTLWSKRVINAQDIESDRDTKNMHEFNAYALGFEGLQSILLPIRDGLTMLRKHEAL